MHENKQLHCIAFHILLCTLLWTPQIRELYICYTNRLQSLLLPHKIIVSCYQLLNSLYHNHMKLASICDNLSFGKAFPLLFFQSLIDSICVGQFLGSPFCSMNLFVYSFANTIPFLINVISMNFNTRVDLCNQHNNQHMEQFHHSKKKKKLPYVFSLYSHFLLTYVWQPPVYFPAQ